eukprot:TRINITY_DN3644_c0_g1_i2.p1 TRINITY_DN3644_c0_g1~~TRINITY_DN3644_c0_g1_i2.p1  ORF type:complete len:382 (-),score=101.07 TRINITY_DN3644_c0_g1_i2:455-1600(-)
MCQQEPSVVFQFAPKQRGSATKAEAADSLHDDEEPPTAAPTDSEDSVDNTTATKESVEQIGEEMKVEAWSASKYRKVKTLQEAMRNKGTVDLMEQLETGQFVAVKRMPNSWICSSKKAFDKLWCKSSELPWLDFSILKHLQMVNFQYACDFLGMYQDGTHTYVVSSLATRGDLFQWCTEQKQLGCNHETQMRPLVLQVLDAVRRLHDLGIAHRDISLENILLTEEGNDDLKIKLIDFGMASVSRMCRGGEVRGKSTYQAPEMHISGPEYDAFLADAFSLGIVFYAMATKDYPWDSTKPGCCKMFSFVEKKGMRRYLQKRPTNVKGHTYWADLLSENFTQVVEGLLAVNPAQRLTLGEACFEEECDPRKNVYSLEWIAGRCS